MSLREQWGGGGGKKAASGDLTCEGALSPTVACSGIGGDGGPKKFVCVLNGASLGSARAPCACPCLCFSNHIEHPDYMSACADMLRFIASGVGMVALLNDDNQKMFGSGVGYGCVRFWLRFWFWLRVGVVMVLVLFGSGYDSGSGFVLVLVLGLFRSGYGSGSDYALALFWFGVLVLFTCVCCFSFCLFVYVLFVYVLFC